ncbi:MAG TPA: enoyl-CoA hydratase-related protein, partial [Longimicrobiales bacterium]
LGGGFELIQAADIVVAAESARFGQPEIVLGVFAPAACALLAERVGATRAAHLLYSGEPLAADEAVAAGLALRVVPDASLEEQALALAHSIARHSGSALRLSKRALRAGRNRPLADVLRQAARIYTDELMQTHDALEGLQAFVEKRRPEWSHR